MHDPKLADLAASLPASVRIESPTDNVLLVSLARAEKRNALDDITVLGLAAVFDALPEGTRAVILAGEGEHFSAGLDLSELSFRDRTLAAVAPDFRVDPVWPGAGDRRAEGGGDRRRARAGVRRSYPCR
jgi:enoyl-CoA hydratase/carnithine racemase